jgi:four helix bundle protein
MFLKLNHKNLTAYSVVREMVKEVYTVSNKWPSNERFALTQQVRRASTSVLLNLAEGASRKSVKERSRFYECSRGSIVEIDAVFEIAVDLKYNDEKDLVHLSELVNHCFALISRMI